MRSILKAIAKPIPEDSDPMKNLVLLIGYIVLFTACAETPKAETASPETMTAADTLSYMSRHLLRTYNDCEDPKDYTCTRAEFDYVLITGGVPDEVRKRINRSILLRLQGDTTSLQAKLDSFLNEYHDYVESDFEFMDEEPGWFYEGHLNLGLNDPRVLTFAFQEYFFTGGAHGNYNTDYWHFNCSNGTSFELSDLISKANMDSLWTLGEQYFRRSMHLRDTGSINQQAGFSFPEDQFYLPNIYALLPEGLTFTFGTYEIASYADGEIRFSIPYSELKELAIPGSVLEELTIKPPYRKVNGS
ncbi:MAG: DUF3298 and DUF4163 domain-containing protein [Bacteroidetes bacterium]|nr:DUF3298 and DUF4163 domain-containing protein [Bacteroidota bacterium]